MTKETRSKEIRRFEVVESKEKDGYALIVIRKIDSENTKLVLAVDLPSPDVGDLVTATFEFSPAQRTPPVCAWCRERIIHPKDRVRVGYENMHADCRSEFQAVQMKVQRTEQSIECPF